MAKRGNTRIAYLYVGSMINQWETTLPITSDRSLSVVDVLAGVSTGSPHTVADELAAAFSDHVAACVG